MMANAASGARRPDATEAEVSDNDIAAATVVAVLLSDGWHQIVPGSFSAGPLSLGANANLGVPGFRFEEADAARPYRPTALAGPLHSIVAIRQASPSVRRMGERRAL